MTSRTLAIRKGEARITPNVLAGLRLIVFDADDTLRRTLVAGQPCPHAEDEWELLPGVRERLTEIEWAALGIAIGVASNQDHVGYGLLDARVAKELLQAMIARATSGAVTDAEIRFCPHRLDTECACRKPAPGMLLDILRTSGVSPDETLFVGNAESDRQAAERAGVRFAWAWEFFGTG